MNYKKANWELFKTKNQRKIEWKWTDIDPEALNNVIHSIIVEAANCAFPSFDINKSKSEQLPPEILFLLREKRRIKRKWNKSFNPYFKYKLKLISDLINEKIIETRSKKLLEFLRTLGPSLISTKPFWKRIKRFRSKPDKGIPTFLAGDIEYDTDEKKQTYSVKLYLTL